MAKIENAFCTLTDTILYANDIALHPDLDSIRHSLYCANTDCPAQLSFVAGKNENHFRTYKGSNHSTDCDDFFNREKAKKRSEIAEQIKVSLSPKDSNNRLSYLFESIYKEKKSRKKKPTKPKPNPTMDETSDTSPYVQTTLGGGGETVEELKDRKKGVRGPSTITHSLNQITSEHEHAIIRSYGKIKKVNVIRENYCEIDVIFNGKEATFVLPESFFITPDVSVKSYLDHLSEYINNEPTFPMMLLSICEVRSYSVLPEKQYLYITDYSWLQLAIEKKPPQKLTLLGFTAQYTRGNFNI